MSLQFILFLLYLIFAMSKLYSSPTARTIFKTISWIPVIVFLVDHGYSFATVEGRSMQPTFNPDSSMLTRDIVLLNRWAVMNHKFQRGEVVTLWSPRNPDRMITKRVIGLEGDTITTLRPYPEKLVMIPKGHCWIEGDEQFHSRDSNVFGPVPLGLINSKVTFILWPPTRFGFVRRQPKPERIILTAGESKNGLTRKAGGDDGW